MAKWTFEPGHTAVYTSPIVGSDNYDVCRRGTKHKKTRHVGNTALSFFFMAATAIIENPMARVTF
jgi:hypothetical protein